MAPHNARCIVSHQPARYRARSAVLAAEDFDLFSNYGEVVSAFFEWRTVTDAKASLSSVLADTTVHPEVAEAIGSALEHFDEVLTAGLLSGDIEVE